VIVRAGGIFWVDLTSGRVGTIVFEFADLLKTHLLFVIAHLNKGRS
jgi:hypothetical protein